MRTCDLTRAILMQFIFKSTQNKPAIRYVNLVCDNKGHSVSVVIIQYLITDQTHVHINHMFTCSHQSHVHCTHQSHVTYEHMIYNTL